MMSGGFQIFPEENCPCFVTCTIVQWLPVFERSLYCQIILDSLASLQQRKRTRLNAFVVMPAHLHAILWPDEGIKLSDVLRDFKRFTSRSISSRAEDLDDYHLLARFKNSRMQSGAMDVSQYQVWQEGSHPEAFFASKFAQQKLDYIHMNPVHAR
jgi:putative transposase